MSPAGAILCRASRPGQRRAVQVGRIRSGQDYRRQTFSPIARLRPKPVHGPGQSELGGAETFDEVATPNPTGLLRSLENGVHGGESAAYPFATYCAPGDDAMAVEECFGRAQRRMCW